MRDIHWYDVVDQEQLLARLALDAGKPSIASRITQLLVRSYFPQGVRGVEQYKRAVKFLKQSPAAALTFYTYVHEHVPVPNITKLILILQKGSSIALKRLCGDADEPGAPRAAKAKAASKKRGLPEADASQASSVQTDLADSEDDAENRDTNGEARSKPVNVALTARIQKVSVNACVNPCACPL
jgi:hypothetical protein